MINTTSERLLYLSVEISCSVEYEKSFITSANADPEGGQGSGSPPGKSQAIWVSIGNKQLDPPLEKVGPPPPPGKCFPQN